MEAPVVVIDMSIGVVALDVASVVVGAMAFAMTFYYIFYDFLRRRRNNGARRFCRIFHREALSAAEHTRRSDDVVCSRIVISKDDYSGFIIVIVDRGVETTVESSYFLKAFARVGQARIP